MACFEDLPVKESPPVEVVICQPLKWYATLDLFDLDLFDLDLIDLDLLDLDFELFP